MAEFHYSPAQTTGCRIMAHSFADHFSAVARSYAEFRPRYPDALFEYLGGLVPEGTVAWDCAAGSGQATVGLARRFARVIATDASAAQLASAPALPNVEYRVAPAEQSGLPDGSVGIVTVAQALHWFDFDAFHREVRRVLQPGGILAVWAYGKQQIEDPRIQALVDGYYSETVGPFWPPERHWVEDGYRTLPFPYDELAAPTLAMTTTWSLPELLGYLSSWSATQRYQEARGQSPIPALAKTLEPLWGRPEERRPIHWPLALRVGTCAIAPVE